MLKLKEVASLVLNTKQAKLRNVLPSFEKLSQLRYSDPQAFYRRKGYHYGYLPTLYLLEKAGWKNVKVGSRYRWLKKTLGLTPTWVIKTLTQAGLLDQAVKYVTLLPRFYDTPNKKGVTRRLFHRSYQFQAYFKKRPTVEAYRQAAIYLAEFWLRMNPEKPKDPTALALAGLAVMMTRSIKDAATLALTWWAETKLVNIRGPVINYLKKNYPHLASDPSQLTQITLDVPILLKKYHRFKGNYALRALAQQVHHLANSLVTKDTAVITTLGTHDPALGKWVQHHHLTVTFLTKRTNADQALKKANKIKAKLVKALKTAYSYLVETKAINPTTKVNGYFAATLTDLIPTYGINPFKTPRAAHWAKANQLPPIYLLAGYKLKLTRNTRPLTKARYYYTQADKAKRYNQRQLKPKTAPTSQTSQVKLASYPKTVIDYNKTALTNELVLTNPNRQAVNLPALTFKERQQNPGQKPSKKTSQRLRHNLGKTLSKNPSKNLNPQLILKPYKITEFNQGTKARLLYTTLPVMKEYKKEVEYENTS